MRAFVLLATVLGAGPAFAETVAITGGTVAIGDGSAPVQGNVVVRDGRIVGAGPGVAVPAGARVVDATGKWVSAGLVAGFSRLGLVEVDGVSSTNDASARATPFNASLDVVDGLNPRVPELAINRAHGITRAVVAPESAGSIFAGLGAVIDLTNNPNDITKARAFQFVEFGEAGARIAGGSRPASHAMFRNMLAEARDYAHNPAGYDGRSMNP